MAQVRKPNKIAVGTWVQTETNRLGLVFETGDPYGDGGNYVNVVFADPVIFAMTGSVEGSLCADDTQWYDEEDVTVVMKEIQ